LLKFHKLLYKLLKWIFKNKIIIWHLSAEPEKLPRYLYNAVMKLQPASGGALEEVEEMIYWVECFCHFSKNILNKKSVTNSLLW
jgi:hypothetical protein